MARNRQRAKDRKQKLKRENVPGSLDNASGDVEEAEAAIVAGADGKPLQDEELEREDADDGQDESLDREQLAAGEVGSAASTKGRSGLRIVNFVRACAAELQRVQWPDRRQTGQATAVVLGFVVIAGAFLGLADTVAQRIIDFII
ncbi:MAG: preprotein translocase subunit SecE [Actinomycetota bacterium]|nr:preprotein translocase subunit SecE [Actinomycetota bacterium]